MHRRPKSIMTACLSTVSSLSALVRFLFVGLLALNAPSGIASADEQSDAAQLVETVRQAAMAPGQGGPANGQLRVISAAFDGRGIARAVLGAYWQDASGDDRAALVDALLYAISRRLTGRLGRLQDRQFAMLGTKVLANGDILVRTEFRRALNRPTSVDWRVRRCRAQLCIGDVLVDGGSVTIQQRDRVSKLLAGNGGSIPALVLDLRRGRT